MLLMRNLFNNIKTLPKALLVLCGIAIFYIILYSFWFINMPDLFPHADKLGQVPFEIAVAIISSLIFFIIVVHLKEEKDKKTLHPYFQRR